MLHYPLIHLPLQLPDTAPDILGHNRLAPDAVLLPAVAANLGAVALFEELGCAVHEGLYHANRSVFVTVSQPERFYDILQAMENDPQSIIHDYMRSLGQSKSDAKIAACRANLEKAHAAQVKRMRPCDCGQFPHTEQCPVYVREYRRHKRLLKKAAKLAENSS